MDKKCGKRGRKRRELKPLEINKINLLWFANQWNLTAISKAMHHSPPVCERHIFKTKDAWHEWSDKLITEGLL